jgi:PIN domain nuclease of toxin-antitoxin system
MSYLVDTHYVLWSLFEPAKISSEIKKLFSDENAIKYVSAITLWEISLKYSLGKLELQDTNPKEVHESIEAAGFEITPVETELFSTYHRLPKKKDHQDPFDRMLIWQAIKGDYILITHDSSFEQYGSDGLRMITQGAKK